MLPADAQFAPTILLARYLAIFQRFFAVVTNSTQNGDKPGMHLGGWLANALHNVPAMLWHRDNSVREDHHFEPNLPYIAAFLADIERMAFHYRRARLILGQD